jgi:hypothetical protein
MVPKWRAYANLSRHGASPASNGMMSGQLLSVVEVVSPKSHAQCFTSAVRNSKAKVQSRMSMFAGGSLRPAPNRCATDFAHLRRRVLIASFEIEFIHHQEFRALLFCQLMQNVSDGRLICADILDKKPRSICIAEALARPESDVDFYAAFSRICSPQDKVTRRTSRVFWAFLNKRAPNFGASARLDAVRAG